MPEPLAELQLRFAAHLRNPQAHCAPEDVEDRRMEIYRGLFFRNLSSFIAKSFPVLRALYEKPDWDTLIREFFDEYRCHTPLFTEIPREFVQYLQDVRGSRPDDPPFLLELAHYEWVEIALDLDARDPSAIPADPDGDLMAGVPVVSPLAWPLSYRFPVHRIRPEFQPAEAPPEATHLLVYRDREDRVRFMQLNPISLLLVQALARNEGQAGREVLQELAGQLGQADPDPLQQSGALTLEDLRRRDVILGVRPETPT